MRDEISFSEVIVENRGRSFHGNIEDLADNIKLNGLIQPIVLDPAFRLVAGGRRYHALKLLGVERLYHATSSDPERPGFVIKGEDEKSTLSNLLAEIAENLNREDLPWQDEMEMLVRAYKLAKSEANSRGEEVLIKDFGSMLGCGYHNLQAAIAIYNDVAEHPERYENVGSLRAAYSELLLANAKHIEQLSSKRTSHGYAPVEAQTGPEPASPLHTINLSSAFHHKDGLEFLASLEKFPVDHIVTDPDYALDIEVLMANAVGVVDGVEHISIEHSLRDLEKFLWSSFKALKPQGFCVFFYDLDHHEKLQTIAKRVGFRVQRWPLIWHKTDFSSNAGPSHNFTKNIEYAMICRKHNATLNQVQTSSVFSCASAGVTKELGHPFAKPYALWNWIYNAITIKNQVVCDPFAGSGSACIAAVRAGLRPIGCEINETHYHTLVHNMQREYTKLFTNVKFT